MNRRHDHPLVDEFAALEHHVVVEQHCAVAHRRVDMALGVALAAHVVVGSGREQEIAGEYARHRLELKDFDYIDVGAMLETSGAVPVVIKSLVFPSSQNLGQDWENTAKMGYAATA